MFTTKGDGPGPSAWVYYTMSPLSVAVLLPRRKAVTHRHWHDSLILHHFPTSTLHESPPSLSVATNSIMKYTILQWYVLACLRYSAFRVYIHTVAMQYFNKSIQYHTTWVDNTHSMLSYLHREAYWSLVGHLPKTSPFFHLHLNLPSTQLFCQSSLVQYVPVGPE